MNAHRIIPAALALAATMSLLAPTLAGTLAHYTFDETVVNSAPAGADFSDSSGNGLHANINDETKVSPSAAGVFGSGVSFNNTSGAYITTPDINGWQQSSFTMAAWVNPNDTGVNTIIGDWASPFSFRLWTQSGSLFWQARRSAAPIDIVLNSGGSITSDGSTFSHVAVTWDRIDDNSATARLWVNGSVVATTNSSNFGTQTVDIINNARNYQIGLKADAVGDAFNGSLDEVWVIDRALTVGEMAALKTLNVANGTRIVSGVKDWVNIIDANETQNTWTEQIVVSDGGESVTLDITLTNAAGEVFSRRDGNARFAVGTGADGNGIESNEDFTLTVSLVSATSKVDLDSIGFNFTGAGLRSLSGLGVGAWTSSVTGSPLAIGGDGTDLNPSLDAANLFHLLNGSDYVGTLDITSGFFQLTDLGAPGGLQYSVAFQVIPAPAALPAGLAMLGLAAARRRRRRN